MTWLQRSVFLARLFVGLEEFMKTGGPRHEGRILMLLCSLGRESRVNESLATCLPSTGTAASVNFQEGRAWRHGA